jgi:epoxyqueuosine reductase QueG
LSDSASILDAVRAAAALQGLNLYAVVPVVRYDAAVQAATRASLIHPAARSIVVLGNGGGDFWAAFKRHAARNPGWLERENPLDDFTREVVEREVAKPLREAALRHTIVHPFMDPSRHDRPTLNFVELGKAAGIAGPSVLGVVVHPTFGPWIAFRAALLLEIEVDAPGDALGFDPCPGCIPRSCISACPVGAVSFPAGWDVPKCLTHRVEVEPDCAGRCHARAGCVLGPEHRYPDDELAYHQMRALRAMRPYYETHIKPKPRA